MKKIQGLKKALEEYKDINAGGYYSQFYGFLMFDVSDGRIWVEEHYASGHSEYYRYYSDDNIINLGYAMFERGLEINEKNVQEFIINYFDGFEK